MVVKTKRKANRKGDLLNKRSQLCYYTLLFVLLGADELKTLHYIKIVSNKCKKRIKFLTNLPLG